MGEQHAACNDLLLEQTTGELLGIVVKGHPVIEIPSHELAHVTAGVRQVPDGTIQQTMEHRFHFVGDDDLFP